MAYELKSSQYNDPDQTSGQHTNGPANLFVREGDCGHWYFVEGRLSQHKVRCLIEEMGLQEFQKKHCTRLADHG